ncbi:MAG: glycosyltransferase [Planctomycetota bacterium]
MSAARTLSIGLVVPCRDEAAVVVRKLANLAACEWPDGARHRVVVVDDGSRDGTAELAREFARDTASSLERVEIDVVTNLGAPGKVSALRTGLDVLSNHGGEYDLVGTTDADVCLEPRALVELERAFAATPSLGLACASQRFVASLADDGTCRAADGRELVDAGGRYDRLTAAVRRFESRRDKLFSAHGQLLLWRRELGVAPRPGVAADDIDLVISVRSLGAGTRMVADARFLEPKVPAGPDRRSQEDRRARAYFAVFEGRTGLGRGAFDRAQWLLYRHLPRLAPRLWHGSFVLLAVVLGLLFSPWWALLSPALWAIVVATPVGRDLERLLRVVARASREAAAHPGGDRWEMARR